MSHGSSTDFWCDTPGCENEAWYRVEAQWTVVDWMDFYVCEVHLREKLRALADHLVDGEPPLVLESYTLPLVSE